MLRTGPMVNNVVLRPFMMGTTVFCTHPNTQMKSLSQDDLVVSDVGGKWPFELLARLLADLSDVPEVDLSLGGFDNDEISKLLKSLESRDKRDRLETFDLDAALEAAQTAPVARTGDVIHPWRSQVCFAVIRRTLTTYRT